MSTIKIILNAVAAIHARYLNKNLAMYSIGRCGFIGREEYIWMFHTLLSAPGVMNKWIDPEWMPGAHQSKAQGLR